MQDELKSLRIDRSRATPERTGGRSLRWWLTAVFVIVLLAVGSALAYRLWFDGPEVEVMQVPPPSAALGDAPRTVLNASGYITAAHKIQVASKVVGRVAWIGVNKGDQVKEGEVLVRLEDDEYRAQLQQARGQLASLEARLQELLNGSRPEEIAAAKASLEEARAQLENARVTLERTRRLTQEGVLSRQALDDAQARFDAQQARVQTLERNYELVRIGPRAEQIAAVRGQVEQARGAVLYAETQLANTLIRAPVTGTILERAVEKGEFVTTSFVGERGAKGYVVSLADLNDLQVELDINQNDFAKLKPRQPGVVTTDAYPDRKYEGVIEEISPEANRQKATVQVKVRILKPDEYLRPEMNASVVFYEDRPPAVSASRPAVLIPGSAVREGNVFVVAGRKVVRQPVKAASISEGTVRVEEGLRGGEMLVLNPSADLKDGARVRVRRKG